MRPIVVDETGSILAGHGAHAAARKLGLETVPVSIVSHLTAPEKRAYMLADNRLAEESTWNKTLVAEELSALELEKFDFTMTGFTDRDLEQMLDELAGGSDPSRSATKPEKGPRMSTDPKATAAATAAANPNAPAAAATASAQPGAIAAQPSAVAAPFSMVSQAEASLSDDKKGVLAEIRKLATELHNKIGALEAGGSRELSLAKTKVEEAVHWVGEHLHK